MNRALSVLALAVSCLLAAPALSQADVLREATGQRRADLDAMELKAFPAVWDGLTEWANGGAIKSADIDGKPVLIVNWATWNPSSVRALGQAQKMSEKFGGQGLVVVGVHHAQGWDTAAEKAKATGATFRIARDTDGAYRKALKVDHEPEYFIADRAGHLRYASVSGGSLDEALTEVTGETAAQAGDVPRILKEREMQALAQSGKTTTIRSEIQLQSLPPVPPGYSQPQEKAYKDTKWPKVNQELGKAFGLLDNQNGKPLEPKLAFQPVAWYPRQPVTSGRIQVIYFWHPELNFTYSPVMDKMDSLQEKHLRDISVTGALIGLKVLKGENAQQQPGQEDDDAWEKLKKKWDRFVSTRHYSHALAADVGMTCLQGLGQQQGGQKFPVPGAMIVSTDGTVRWMGFTMDHLGRWDADFIAALDKCIDNDPGVTRRKTLDRAFIENLKK